jgi:hypothetical protein
MIARVFRRLGPWAALALLPALSPAQNVPAPAAAPALVVLITVDQMRADYLRRYGGQWVGGFRRFYRDGTVFEHGLQDHAATETAPGHATLLSGREPEHTEIALNSRGVQDPGSPVLGMVDSVGASPRRFHGSTLYDWMLAQDPEARVLSVSRKDRGAIAPIGRARGTVLWFAGGQFTTSRYYADAIPSWVRAFNDRGGVLRLAGTTWDLLRPDSAYSEPDSMPFENAGRDFVFPHRLPAADAIARGIVGYPWMDSLTLALALDGVSQLQLGQRPHTDLLAVSLSTTDAVGHTFGPDSREIHDQLLRVDLWLGQFADSLARLVPGRRIVFVLTGDHGISSLPEYAVLVRHQPAGRISLAGFASELEATLESRFRMDFGLTVDNGLMTADVDAMQARGVNVDSLAAALAAEVRRVPGVAAAYTPASLAAAPDSDPAAYLWRELLPPRFGWLVCASTRPGYIWSGGSLGGEHGAGNSEDEEVPIVFLGAGIPARLVERPVRTVDIAPTLARLLRVQPTEPLDGVVLPEVAGPQPREPVARPAGGITRQR